MQPATQSAPSKVQSGPTLSQKGNYMKENTFTRSEKTKDIRSTNITAAKGNISLYIFFLN